MDEEERISLIRRGNELFNKKDYKNALKIFIATGYKDGIIRVADHLYFDKGEKLMAIKLYKRAGHQKVIEDFAEKVASIIRMMLEEDKALKAQEKEKEVTIGIDEIKALDNSENEGGEEKNVVDEGE